MKEITVQEVQESIKNGEKLNLIDVREVAEVQEDHIPGIINIPLGLLEFRLQELNKNTPYIIICRSGGRSGQATEFLTYHGYDATNMVGGMLAFKGNVE
ncbi:rhodanese-like domain-containing protein [Paenibacillus sp. FSL R5-0345]|uniref:rhodanese-like domain-containing protein n=1 Tax=unclassified Paenibacillus TaxID=185978 RepID=UPI0004F66D8C|nr:rhodanese-like domain-containing protein [Paenibacillus sp. FSL R5-0345]AIQ36023.1 rhodanese domain protein [Paenibacillus sp. FSL R5-0345]